MSEWTPICLLATLRHEELQALNDRERLASIALASRGPQPGVVTIARLWLGSVLIGIGTRLQGMTEAGATPDAIGSPGRAGMS
jgi:hypothetical protein